MSDNEFERIRREFQNLRAEMAEVYVLLNDIKSSNKLLLEERKERKAFVAFIRNTVLGLVLAAVFAFIVSGGLDVK